MRLSTITLGPKTRPEAVISKHSTSIHFTNINPARYTGSSLQYSTRILDVIACEIWPLQDVGAHASKPSIASEPSRIFVRETERQAPCVLDFCLKIEPFLFPSNSTKYWDYSSLQFGTLLVGVFRSGAFLRTGYGYDSLEPFGLRAFCGREAWIE